MAEEDRRPLVVEEEWVAAADVISGEIAEWTVAMTVEWTEVDHARALRWATTEAEDDGTTAAMIGDGTMTIIADPDPARCLTTDGRAAAEDDPVRGAGTALFRAVPRVPARGRGGIKRRALLRGTRNRGGTLPRGRGPAADRTAGSAAAAAADLARGPSLGRIRGGDRGLVPLGISRLRLGPRMTARERISAGTARSATTRAGTSTSTRASGRRGPGPRGRGATRFTAAAPLNRPRGPGAGAVETTSRLGTRSGRTRERM